MTTEEILKAATPRPWHCQKSSGLKSFEIGSDNTLSPCDIADVWHEGIESAQANAALIVLAVNSYERDQATIKALVEAANTALVFLLQDPLDGQADAAISKLHAVLALAKGGQQ